MKYFYDTEFNEDGTTIDLISIAIVAEDGREYYACSREFNRKRAEANQFVADNVLPLLPPRDTNLSEMSPADREASKAWKWRAQIKSELIEFCDIEKYGPIELWAVYSAYDHVALTQLFGTITQLPPGWPMWTNDLKTLALLCHNPALPDQQNEHDALADARWYKQVYDQLSQIFGAQGELI